MVGVRDVVRVRAYNLENVWQWNRCGFGHRNCWFLFEHHMMCMYTFVCVHWLGCFSSTGRGIASGMIFPMRFQF